MPTSVLEAIKLGQWDFEPKKVNDSSFCPTRAIPGSREKLTVLAARIESGLPLWHPSDSRNYADSSGDDED